MKFATGGNAPEQARDTGGLRERVYQTPADHHHSEKVPCRLPMCAVAFQRAILDYLDNAALSQGAAHEERACQHTNLANDGRFCLNCRTTLGAAHEERGLDVERLAKGIRAGLTLRLIAGNTDQKYTPNEVATMVAAVIEEQVARLATPEAAPDPRPHKAGCLLYPADPARFCPTPEAAPDE